MSDSQNSKSWTEKAESASKFLSVVAWCLILVLLVVYMFRDGGININVNNQGKGLLSDYLKPVVVAPVVATPPVTNAAPSTEKFSAKGTYYP